MHPLTSIRASATHAIDVTCKSVMPRCSEADQRDRSLSAAVRTDAGISRTGRFRARKLRFPH
jgi:hypothetical protein